MKKICAAIMAASCAPFMLVAGEPKAGEAPPPLRLESILQAPSDAQPRAQGQSGRTGVLGNLVRALCRRHTAPDTRWQIGRLI